MVILCLLFPINRLFSLSAIVIDIYFFFFYLSGAVVDFIHLISVYIEGEILDALVKLCDLLVSYVCCET